MHGESRRWAKVVEFLRQGPSDMSLDAQPSAEADGSGEKDDLPF
jgi:hypothetical protein